MELFVYVRRPESRLGIIVDYQILYHNDLDCAVVPLAIRCGLNSSDGWQYD